MNIEKKLKKIGIEKTKEFTKEQKETVAKKVTDMLIESFPILQDEYNNILIKLCNCNMWYAKIKTNLASVNYIYQNNSIYFDEKVFINSITDIIIHEFIHYLQDFRNIKGKLNKIGLCKFNELSMKGLGINEAAVQYMASKIIKQNKIIITKCNITLKTISPNYYPLMTNLIEQIIFLIGENTIVKGVIENNEDFNDTFFNTFEENAQKIINNFDEIIELNNDISFKKRKNLQELIASTYIETQDLIMQTYFEKQCKLVENTEEIEKVSKKLNEYIELTGKIKIDGHYYKNCEIYKSKIMSKLDKKMIELYASRNRMALTVIYSSKLNKLIQKIKSYFKV